MLELDSTLHKRTGMRSNQTKLQLRVLVLPVTLLLWRCYDLSQNRPHRIPYLMPFHSSAFQWPKVYNSHQSWWTSPTGWLCFLVRPHELSPGWSFLLHPDLPVCFIMVVVGVCGSNKSPLSSRFSSIRTDTQLESSSQMVDENQALLAFQIMLTSFGTA